MNLLFPLPHKNLFCLGKSNPLKIQRLCHRQKIHSQGSLSSTFMHIHSISVVLTHTELQTEVFYGEYNRASQDFKPTSVTKAQLQKHKSHRHFCPFTIPGITFVHSDKQSVVKILVVAYTRLYLSLG